MRGRGVPQQHLLLRRLYEEGLQQLLLRRISWPEDGDYFNDLFEFNIPEAHWTRVDSQSKPSVRTDHSCVVYEASLYIFGGFDGRTRFQAPQDPLEVIGEPCIASWKPFKTPIWMIHIPFAFKRRCQTGPIGSKTESWNGC